MKPLIIFNLIFLSLNSNAQLIKSSGKKWNSKETIEKINDTTVYFLDNEKKGGKFDILPLIKAEDIASITAYFEDEPELPSIFKEYLKNGAISFITKKYAINQYRPELSKLSSDYSELTKSHSIERDSLFYIIEGEILTPNVEGKLMKLNYAKIKEIKVLLPEEAVKVYGDKARLGAVIISSLPE